MKLIFTTFFLLINLFVFSQNTYKVVEKNETSALLKGTISGIPITLYLENKEIIDCDIYDTFIDGWYCYDKYKIKIPLSGFSNSCDIKLFNFGKNHISKIKKIKVQVTSSNIDSLYEKSNYQEELKFDKCQFDNKKIGNWKGGFLHAGKKAEIIINSNDFFVGKESEYFKLPNSNQIDLRQTFNGYGGNKFFSLKQDKNENRVVFYFHSISNHNACGMCGASEGEKGYRIIYFDKNWNIKKKEEFMIESCLEILENTKIINKSTSLIKYKVMNSDNKIMCHLTIDKVNSRITKTK